MKQIPLLLIGFGAHAKRIYYKIAKRDGDTYGFRIASALDIDAKKQDIESFLSRNNDTTTAVYYTSGRDRTDGYLKPALKKMLHEIIAKQGIRGVIIATDPAAHMAYARWALFEGLSILMDKPISVHSYTSTDPHIPKLLLADYRNLLRYYDRQKQKYPGLLFSLMAQRRFHPAFQKMKSLIVEVQKRTNCPVTSIQSFHGDGQWRLPDELTDIRYHGFTDGYGKCSHSGYHFFDTLAWLLEAGEGMDKRVDAVDISVNEIRPTDYLGQLTPADYRKIFPDGKFSRVSEEKLRDFGEIDAFCSFAFKQKNKTLTLGSINLVHNSFSQRGWYSTAGRDLYKGNGRLRHEIHIIEQGPFQAIEFISLQSEEVRPTHTTNLYEPGGEYHLDMHVFRNHALFPDWKSYEKISIADLTNRELENGSRGHQEDARRNAVLEFVTSLHGNKIAPISDFSDHKRSTILMTGAYQSMADKFTGKEPRVTLSFKK